MNLIPVEGESNYFRNKNNNSIINTDMQGYNNYLQSRKIKDQEKKKIEKLENELVEIKSDLSEIKDLLRNLSK